MSSLLSAHHVSSRALNSIWWWTWASVAFFYTILYGATAAQLLRATPGGNWIAVQLVLLTVAAVPAYVSSLRFRDGLPDGGRIPWRLVLSLAIPAMALALTAVFSGGLAALIPVWITVSHVACLLPRRVRGRGFAVGAASVAGLGALVCIMTPRDTWWPAAENLGRNTTLMVAFYVLFVPVLVIGSVWWWDAVERLRRGRAAEAQLAAARERLRIAADLHDIQGHHLQVIALQAELGERLMARDPAAAAASVRAVRTAAAEAMEETRAVVSGLRQVSFAVELENAADVLNAAGIACDISGWGRDLTGHAREVLGWVMREATTNMIRHARPNRAELTLLTDGQRATLTVVNDGVFSEEAGADGAGVARGNGSGLASLRERVAAVGGTFSAEARNNLFSVRAEVPMETSST